MSEVNHDLQALQMSSIFRNRFGVSPDDIGLTVDGYTASGNGHQLQLHVEHGKVIDWKLDGQSYCPHEILQKHTTQAANLTRLRQDLGLTAAQDTQRLEEETA
jgi:hypothetical protein